jgi:hypothetical protein
VMGLLCSPAFLPESVTVNKYHKACCVCAESARVGLEFELQRRVWFVWQGALLCCSKHLALAHSSIAGPNVDTSCQLKRVQCSSRSFT